MAKILKKRGLEIKKEQAKRIAEDTGFSETYVRDLIAEPTSTTPAVKGEVMPKPPLKYCASFTGSS